MKQNAQHRFLPTLSLLSTAVIIGLSCALPTDGIAALIGLAESFETNGDGGVRYLSNSHHSDGGTGEDYWERHQFNGAGGQNPHPNFFGTGGPIVGIDGNFAFAGEDVDTAANPLSVANSQELGVVRLNDLDVSGFTDLKVTVGFGWFDPTLTVWDADSTIAVQAAFDSDSGGTSADVFDLKLGNYTTVGGYVGSGALGPGPFLDVNLNGVVDGGETIELVTGSLVDQTFMISGINGLAFSGNVLSVQVVTSAKGNEQMFIDHIRVEGSPAAIPDDDMDGIPNVDDPNPQIPNAIGAEANGPYNIVVGDTLNLSSLGSFADHGIVAFDWDLNNDGVFGDVSGSNPSVPFSALSMLGADGLGPHIVALRVTDGQGNITTDITESIISSITPPPGINIPEPTSVLLVSISVLCLSTRRRHVTA